MNQEIKKFLMASCVWVAATGVLVMYQTYAYQIQEAVALNGPENITVVSAHSQVLSGNKN